MNDDHMAVWELERHGMLESAWEFWVRRVEKLIGHDLDGDQDFDGYSLDTTYEMWESGLTPVEAFARIEASKRDAYREV